MRVPLSSVVVIILLNFLLHLAYSVDHPDVPPSQFCYDVPSCGPKSWGGECRNGKQQSPINIPFSQDTQITCIKIHFNKYYLMENIHHFFGQNNGHSAQFELNPNTSALHSNLQISGGNLKGKYRFGQLHFHWGEVNSQGSEHTVNHKRFPLELHLVHYKSTYSTLAAALRTKNDREAVLVVAVLFKIGRYNHNLVPIIRSLAKLHKPTKVKEFNMSVNIFKLYPKNLEFVEYKGSLTTPTCDQKVIWFVFLHPMEISQGQINQFRHLSNAEGNSNANFRPIQPLNGRVLKYYLATVT